MTAPYLQPADLLQQPLGVSWLSIAQTGTIKQTLRENLAALSNICWQATASAEAEAGQPLRATVATEALLGPSHRLGILPSGVARMTTSQGPVVKVIRVQTHMASAFPYTNWTALPRGHAFPEEEVYGLYNSTAPGQATGGGFSILIDNTYVNWALGPKGLRVQATYVAGWPHTQLVTKVTADAMTLKVTDVTGWAGATGWITDAQRTEQITCIGVTPDVPPEWSTQRTYVPGQYVGYGGKSYMCVQMSGPQLPTGVTRPSGADTTAVWLATPEPAGPGTLSLLSGTASEHTPTVIVTSLPFTIRWATALYAKAQGLQRGVATLAVGSNAVSSAGGLEGAITSALREAAVNILPYRRVW